MAKKPIDELGRTTLEWPEYQKQANELLKKVPTGENWQDYLTEELGKGYWDFEGVKTEYGFNRAHGKIKRKRKRVRQANLKQAAKIRKENEKFTDITSEEAAKAWKKKNITDWNNKNNPTGKKLVKGTEDYNKYFRRYEHRIKVSDPFWKGNTGLDYLSGDPENLTWTTKSQWDLKDAGEMKHGKNYIFDVDQYTGEVAYTPRKGFDPHASKFDKYDKKLLQAKEVAEKLKLGKLAKKGARLAGVAGTAFVVTNLNGKVHAAVKDPSAKNLGLAGLATADAVLEGLEYATGGLALPITTLLQAGIIGAETVIEDGTAKISTANRRRYRHGNR
jgi:hypothetical protein